jgi:hypothetical protein
LILLLLTVDGSRFKKEVKREPSGPEFIKRVWTDPFFEDCTRVSPVASDEQLGGSKGWTVLSRHVVAFTITT